MPKVKRSSYSVAEKLQVLQYAKQYGLRSAGCHFTIDPSMISRWQNQIKNVSKYSVAYIYFSIFSVFLLQILTVAYI